MKIYLIIVIFLLLSAFFIVSENDLKLNDSQKIKQFFSLYFNWFEKIGNNFSTITGEVVNLEWTPSKNN